MTLHFEIIVSVGTVADLECGRALKFGRILHIPI